MTKTYEAALEASRKAAREFTAAQVAYRTRQIGDAEFLVAKAKYDESEKAFDAAYAKEAY
jgi:hypothetical protein